MEVASLKVVEAAKRRAARRRDEEHARRAPALLQPPLVEHAWSHLQALLRRFDTADGDVLRDLDLDHRVGLECALGGLTVRQLHMPFEYATYPRDTWADVSDYQTWVDFESLALMDLRLGAAPLADFARDAQPPDRWQVKPGLDVSRVVGNLSPVYHKDQYEAALAPFKVPVAQPPTESDLLSHINGAWSTACAADVRASLYYKAADGSGNKAHGDDVYERIETQLRTEPGYVSGLAVVRCAVTGACRLAGKAWYDRTVFAQRFPGKRTPDRFYGWAAALRVLLSHGALTHALATKLVREGAAWCRLVDRGACGWHARAQPALRRTSGTRRFPEPRRRRRRPTARR